MILDLFINKLIDMKAEELRIGSYVYVDNEKNHPQLKDIPMKVTSISEAESLKRGIWTHAIGIEHIIKLKRESENHNFEDWYQSNRAYNQFLFLIKPLPLTEDWLLRFGFERDTALEDIEFGSDLIQFKYGIKQENSFIRICFHKGGQFTLSFRGTALVKPKYVHQLQNLYYSLTQKELGYEKL